MLKTVKFWQNYYRYFAQKNTQFLCKMKTKIYNVPPTERENNWNICAFQLRRSSTGPSSSTTRQGRAGVWNVASMQYRSLRHQLTHYNIFTSSTDCSFTIHCCSSGIHSCTREGCCEAACNPFKQPPSSPMQLHKWLTRCHNMSIAPLRKLMIIMRSFIKRTNYMNINYF